MPMSSGESRQLARAAREAKAVPCRIQPDLFFAELPQDVEQAKALCRECPLQELCLQAGLEAREPWGVWGGELLERGRIVARKRGRGRPRKSPAAA